MKVINVNVSVYRGSVFTKPYAESLEFVDVNTNSKIKMQVERLERESGCAVVFVTRIIDRRRMKRLRSVRLALYYIGNIDECSRASAKRQILEKINATDYTIPAVKKLMYNIET